MDSVLGPNPTLAHVALYFREVFRRIVPHDQWLTFVSPLDVANAARARGIEPCEGRIPREKMPDAYFELIARAKQR